MIKHTRKRVFFVVVAVSLGWVMISYHALDDYNKKRNFKTSPEPTEHARVKKHAKAIFVVQKHDASHLHYDFRLEMNGALKSWAVPKGPSKKVGEKRLAVETEDHPLGYATFEGTIPEGNYGAGTVEVWDHGTFENIKYEDEKLVPLSRCYQDGHIEIALHGKKMHGNYALVRMDGDNKKNWLLIKMREHDEKDTRTK